jgi:RNA polymerase sigma-70 factor (ECF subfamily)
MISRICASYESDNDLARDLAQDVLLALWRALPTYRGESSLKTFVARIAQFRAISHASRHSKLPLFDSLEETIRDNAALPEALAIEAEQRNKLLAAVRHLPLAYREPAVLTLEDFTPAEIATVIGISADLVAVRLSRARSMLRTLLGGGSHEG